MALVIIKKYGCCWLVLGLISAVPVVSAAQYTETGAQSLELLNTDPQHRKSFAKTWDITDSDISRYQAIMKGKRGVWSPDIDPLLALGVHAQNSAERQRFAELYVKAEFERTERELAFQREVDAAWKRLYPTTLPVSGLRAAANKAIPEPLTERLALFVSQQCDICPALMAKTLKRAKQLAVSVDIYLVDSAGNDGLLARWAQAEGISPELVKQGAITLNHIANEGPKEAPALYIKRKGMNWEREQ